MKKISILLFLFCISLVFAYAANSQNPNSSSHYIDNGNRSITDTQTGLTWLKCNVDSKAANCSDNKQLQYVPVGVAGESPSDLSCYNDDSGTSRCANGVLCNDGIFVTVDWRSDFMQYKDDYLPYTDHTKTCFVNAPDTAKERTCSKHGGVAIKKWRVPTLTEIKTIFDPNLPWGTGDQATCGGTDLKFFPYTKGYYQTTGPEDSTGFGPSATEVKRKFFFFPEGGTTDEISGCLRCVSDQKGGRATAGGPVFCEQKIPFKIYIESEQNGINKPCKLIDKMWKKEDENMVYYYVRTISEAPTSFTGDSWTICNKNNGVCTQYNSTVSNGCTKTTIPYDQSFFSPTTKPEKFYANEVTGIKKTVNGIEGNQLVTPRINKGQFGSNSIEVKSDFVNKEYCESLHSEIIPHNAEYPEGDLHSITQVLRLSRDVSDSVFIPPSGCTEGPKADYPTGESTYGYVNNTSSSYKYDNSTVNRENENSKQPYKRQYGTNE